MKTFEDLLEEMRSLYEDFVSRETCELCGKKECECDSMGSPMEIPDEVKLDSPKNVGKMIESAKYGSMGKINITISLGD